MKNLLSMLLLPVLLTACATTGTPSTTAVPTGDAPSTRMDAQQLEGLSKAYFASGCFWCVEEVFESVRGVKEAVSGYSGGPEEDPTYEQVGSGATGHAEAVLVYYDPAQVDFPTLVRVFFASQDPTTPNRQGPDRGRQYRSIAFYQTAEEKAAIDRIIAKLNASGKYDAPIATEVTTFMRFWPAEDYHQDYIRHNPDVSYVRSVSIPRFERFKEAMPEVLK